MGVDRIVCVVGDCDDAVASLAPRAVVYDTALTAGEHSSKLSGA